MTTWNVMIDLETADTARSALVLSAAAVEFRIIGGKPLVRASKLWVPDAREQIALGRTVNPDTIKWWQGQDSGARLHWQAPSPSSVCSLTGMLHDIRNFVFNAGNGPVWAHGVVFDIGILEDLYAQIRMSVPWRYSDIRDARTVVRGDFCKIRDVAADVTDLVPHDPLADCIFQINSLAEYIEGEPSNAERT